MKRNSFIHRVFARILLSAGIVHATTHPPESLTDGRSDPIDPKTRFETGDISIKGVIWAGVGVLGTLWVIVLLMYPIFALLNHERTSGMAQPIQAAAHGVPLPPEPRLQQDPSRDLDEMRSAEAGQLTQYHWVDRAHGIASIPIDEAIHIISRKGIPPQSAPNDLTYFDPHQGTRLTGFEGKVAPEPQ